MAQVREAAKAMAPLLADPNANGFEIQGHTDNIGQDSYNKTLSQRRALSVGEALVALGIDPKRLLPRGYGASVPIAPNDTDLGRAQNRRVVLKRL